MKTILKVETKYNENLAAAQALVVTVLSNISRYGSIDAAWVHWETFGWY